MLGRSVEERSERAGSDGSPRLAHQAIAWASRSSNGISAAVNSAGILARRCVPDGHAEPTIGDRGGVSRP
jgi:hypothetical protein